MFKCHNCKLILEESELEFGKCPICKGNTIAMCENDNGSCSHGIVGGTKICDICGEFICPKCGAHDVTPISRVTGYLSPIHGWNKSKQQELIDRTRYNV